MKYDKTDKIISEKYLAVEPDFDAAGAWSQLEPKIKRRKRRGFWMWYVGGVSLILFVAIYQMSIKDEVADSTISKVINERDIVNFTEVKDESNGDNVQVNNKLGSEFEVNDHIPNSLNTYSADKEARNDIINSKNLISNIKTTTEPKKLNEVDESILTEVNLSNKYESNVAGRWENNEVYGEMTNKRLTESIQLISSVVKQLKYDRQIDILLSYSLMPPISDISKKSKMRFGVYGGYFTYNRSLKHSGLGSSNNYESRVSEEKARDAFDLGLKLDYFITNKIVVFGGVRYDQSYVERNADYIYLESITLQDQIIRVIETEEGRIEEKGSVTYDGYYRHNANNYLTSKRLGVLAGIQYRIGNDKWNSFVNLGIELPISTSLSGVITNDGKPYNLSDDSFKFTKSKPLVFGGIGGEYALSGGVGLQVMIGGYLPTGNEYSESYNIIKKSTQLGVNLGLHFQL